MRNGGNKVISMGKCYSCIHFQSCGSICDLGIYGEDAKDCTHHTSYCDVDYEEDEDW